MSSLGRNRDSWLGGESSLTLPTTEASLPSVGVAPLPEETSEWLGDWQAVYARDLIDSRIVSVDAETSVEEACEILLSEDILCLAIKSIEQDSHLGPSYLGLFDFADVNAFLTLAATRHTLPPEDLWEKPRVNEIVNAARAGRVPVHLVSDLSEKNPLRTLPNDATVVSLLEVFSRGAHRVLIHGQDPPTDYIGMVSDRGLLAWFFTYSERSPSLRQLASNPLHSLAMPSLNINASVVAAKSTDCVLDAMKLMSDGGVSSVAVIQEETGGLLSAVSVTDIGKIVVPTQSNQILSTPLHQFISQIKAPYGSTDGADKFPVFSVSPSSSLAYTISKLLATNAHRLFVTREVSGSTSPVLAPSLCGNLSGIVSVVDILSLFARLVNITDVDPTWMQRRRRASSTSSTSSSWSDRDFILNQSRSGSRTSARRSFHGPPTSLSDKRKSMSAIESFVWSANPIKKE